MRNRAALMIGTLLLVLSTTTALAQAPSAPPKPGPEAEKLGVYVGKWTSAADAKPGGKITWISSCEWISDGFGVLCHETTIVPGVGEVTDVGLMSYDAGAKNFVLFQVNNKGQSWVFRSAPEGDTWPWTSQVTMNGQTMQMRFTVKWTSKDSYDFKTEAGPTADSMAVVMDGKGTRAPATKPAPK